MEATDTLSFRDRFKALLRISYAELQYWLTGLTPESYHLAQSRNYESFGAYVCAIHHARRFLDLKEHAETRARLGFCYEKLRKNSDAVREYRKAVAAWDHPAVKLGLAQAEFRTGNVETATKLLREVEGSDMGHHLRFSIAELKREMAGASNHRLHTDAAKP